MAGSAMRRLAVLAGALLIAPISVLMPLDWTGRSAAALEQSSCGVVSPASVNGKNVFKLGDVWSGVFTSIGSLVRHDGTILLVYYDADRWVTVAEVDPKTGKVCKKRLDSQFSGWDSHNMLIVAESPDGVIHVSGNAHAKPLFYARTKDSDFSTLETARMIGENEAKVTYPRFVESKDGRFFFLYRDGSSGAGTWLANEWSKSGWSRVGAVFGGRDGDRNVSAYPSPFVAGQDGAFHVAVVWRRTTDASTNYMLSYASTRNFATWKDSRGQSLAGPLTPQSMEPVSRTGEGRGLLNSPLVQLDANDKPVIIYEKYGAEDTNAVFVSRPGDQGWAETEVAHSTTRVDVSGTGSLPGMPVVILSRQDGNIVGRVRFKSEKMRRFTIDLYPGASAAERAAKTSGADKATDDAVSKNDYAIDKKMYDGLDSVQVVSRPINAEPQGGSPVARITWFAQTANNDRQRECTKSAPLACKPPPSPLMLIVK